VKHGDNDTLLDTFGKKPHTLPRIHDSQISGTGRPTAIQGPLETKKGTRGNETVKHLSAEIRYFEASSPSSELGTVRNYDSPVVPPMKSERTKPSWTVNSSLKTSVWNSQILWPFRTEERRCWPQN